MDIMANVLLAAGMSPAMAHSLDEVCMHCGSDTPVTALQLHDIASSGLLTSWASMS
jgi:hypothetical protein